MTTESPVTVDLERLEELAKAATPGPWKHHENNRYVHGDHRNGLVPQTVADCRYRNGLADAAYIAAANPQAILALIAENRRLARLGELDVAWAEVEKALPEGWTLHLVDYGPPGPYNPSPDQPFGGHRYEATAKLGILSSPAKHRAREATPADALRALAAALQESHDAD